MIESSSTRSDAVLVAGNEDLINYREPSRAAVVALLLGVLSIVVVLSVMFLLLPILAIVAALVALRNIGRSEYLTGRGMALTGLGLGAFWLAMAVVGYQMENRAAKSAAQEFSIPWVELLIDGRIMEAHQLMQHPGARVGPEGDLANHYETSETEKEGLESFQNGPVILRLEQLSDRKLVPIPTGQSSVQRTEDAWYVSTFFHIRDMTSGEDLMKVRVGMQRNAAKGEEGPYYSWRATGIELID
ncbi:MAG: DUF4190 domain-containing protein [Pirellulaceae bacterium]